jgi:hypothetical protein
MTASRHRLVSRPPITAALITEPEATMSAASGSEAAPSGLPDAERFEAFLDHLRRVEFAIGPEQIAEAYKILLLAHAEAPDGPVARRLKWMLAPIVARSPTQEEDFYRQFDERFAAQSSGPAARKIEGLAARPATRPAPSLFGQWLRALLGAGALAFVAAGAIGFWAWRPTPISPTPPVPPPTEPGPGLSFLTQPGYMTFSTPTLARRPGYAAARVGLIALPLLTFVAWTLWRWRRRELWLERHPRLREADPSRLALPQADQPLFPSAQLTAIAPALRHHRRITTRDLDVERTIPATIDAGGSFTPVWQTVPRSTEYLFLVERESVHDHVAGILDIALDRLEHEGVFLERFYFRSDPRWLTRGAAARRSTAMQPVADVAARHSDHRLAVLGTADGFFEPLSDRLEPRIEQALLQWGQRAVLSTKPIEAWSWRELALVEDAGFDLATASSSGLRALADRAVAPEEHGRMLEGVVRSRPARPRSWDAAAAKEIAVLRGADGTLASAAFSPDGSRIVTASFDQTARIWDATTAKEIALLRGHANAVYSGTFSPDGSRIVTASQDNTARIWDAATAKEIAVLRGHEGSVYSATFSPDASRIVTASLDKTARIWDAATAKEIAVLRGHENWVTSAAFSPDGSRIITVSRDKTARIWDAATAKAIAVLRGHDNQVTSAAFSRDGSRIVTASWDNTARIWDAATAKEIAVLRGHANAVYSGTFSPDGSRIVTASLDKTAPAVATNPQTPPNMLTQLAHDDDSTVRAAAVENPAMPLQVLAREPDVWQQDDRVAQVITASVSGTGYMIADRVLLTANVVVPADTCDVILPFLRDPRISATVRYRGRVAYRSSALDLALVEITSANEILPRISIPFGRVRRDGPTNRDCIVLGARRSHSRERPPELIHLLARFQQIAASDVYLHITLAPSSTPPRDMADLAGLAGSMVFSAQLPIAILQTISSDRLLQGSPIAELLAEPKFLQYWDWRGLPGPRAATLPYDSPSPIDVILDRLGLVGRQAAFAQAQQAIGVGAAVIAIEATEDDLPEKFIKGLSSRIPYLVDRPVYVPFSTSRNTKEVLTHLVNAVLEASYPHERYPLVSDNDNRRLAAQVRWVIEQKEPRSIFYTIIPPGSFSRASEAIRTFIDLWSAEHSSINYRPGLPFFIIVLRGDDQDEQSDISHIFRDLGVSNRLQVLPRLEKIQRMDVLEWINVLRSLGGQVRAQLPKLEIGLLQSNRQTWTLRELEGDVLRLLSSR